jgi:hypothetical protein
MFGQCFLGRLRLPVRPFPLCTALPAPSPLSGSDALTVLRLPVGGASLGLAPQEPSGPPTFLTLRSTPTTRFVDPDRPSGRAPPRVLWVGCWGVQPIAVCMRAAYGAVSRFGECGLPCGLRGALCTLHPCRSAGTSGTGATLGRSGGFDRPPQGLTPCTKRHAALGALTPGLSRRLPASARASLPLPGVGCRPMLGGGCVWRPVGHPDNLGKYRSQRIDDALVGSDPATVLTQAQREVHGIL